MGGEETILKTTIQLSVLQLTQILIDIKEHSWNTCVRFRLLGEMWQLHMMRIVSVNGNRALLLDETKNQLISIDLNMVMQFEVDNKFKQLQPYYHYDVFPDKAGE